MTVPSFTGVAIAAIVTVAQATQSPEQRAAFRARVDVVSVPVTVMKDRNPVGDLGEQEFALTDNGVPQQVHLDSAAVPIDLTIVLCGVQPAEAERAVAGLVDVRAILPVLRADDRFRIIECDVAVREARPMTFVGTAPGLTQQRPVGAGVPEAYRGQMVTVTNSLNDAVFLALAWPTDPARRHLVVVLGDGFDPWTSTLEPEMIPALAMRSDAVIHAVMVASPSNVESGERHLPRAHLDRWSETYQALEKAARVTGGELHFAAGRPGSLDQVVRAFRASYLLRYTPRDVSRSAWHEIVVKVTRRGVKVIAKKGYFDPQ